MREDHASKRLNVTDFRNIYQLSLIFWRCSHWITGLKFTMDILWIYYYMHPKGIRNWITLKLFKNRIKLGLRAVGVTEKP